MLCSHLLGSLVAAMIINTSKPIMKYTWSTLDERKAIPNDAPAFWSVCLDKGYIGPGEDTPEIRRITPRKVIRDDEEKKDSEHISALRVKVECFFSRMTSIWLITKVN